MAKLIDLIKQLKKAAAETGEKAVSPEKMKELEDQASKELLQDIPHRIVADIPSRKIGKELPKTWEKFLQNPERFNELEAIKKLKEAGGELPRETEKLVNKALRRRADYFPWTKYLKNNPKQGMERLAEKEQHLARMEKISARTIEREKEVAAEKAAEAQELLNLKKQDELANKAFKEKSMEELAGYLSLLAKTAVGAEVLGHLINPPRTATDEEERMLMKRLVEDMRE